MEVSTEGTRAYLGEVSCLLYALEDERGSAYYREVERVKNELEEKLGLVREPDLSPVERE